MALVNDSFGYRLRELWYQKLDMGQTDSRTFEGKVVQILSGHSRSVLHCEFTPDGTVLATCSADKTVLLWNVATGELIRSLEGHTAEVTCCCFYENVLATSSKDKTVVLWLYENGRRASRLGKNDKPVYSRIASHEIIVQTTLDA